MKKIIRIFITVLTLLFLLQTVSKANDPCVFITLNSAKYHLAGCDYMTSRPHPVSLSYARANGYGPCQHCRPYMPAEIEDDYTWLAITFAVVLSIIVLGIIMYFYSKNKKGKLYNKVNNKIKYIKQKFKRKSKTNKTSNYQNAHAKIGYSPSIDILKVNNIYQDGQNTDHNRKENKEEDKYKEKTEVKDEETSEKNKELSMKWYKFWNYVDLPITFALNVLCCIFHFIEGSGEAIYELSISIYVWSLIKLMNDKKKKFFVRIMILVGLQTISIATVIVYNSSKAPSFIFNFIVLLLIWFLPNYIYFKKRKDIFIN